MNNIHQLVLTIQKNAGDIVSNLEALEGLLNTSELKCPECGAELFIDVKGV